MFGPYLHAPEAAESFKSFHSAEPTEEKEAFTPQNKHPDPQPSSTSPTPSSRDHWPESWTVPAANRITPPPLPLCCWSLLACHFSVHCAMFILPLLDSRQRNDRRPPTAPANKLVGSCTRATFRHLKRPTEEGLANQGPLPDNDRHNPSRRFPLDKHVPEKGRGARGTVASGWRKGADLLLEGTKADKY
uniref:Uncharacterized protein n=1 Tax=Steinernema glaseri TaxID=37863 RepID=A0A1I8A759_9BILA